MRGKLSVYVFALDSIGITPADAGKTIVYAVNAAYTWDHPRGCGENRPHGKKVSLFAGSPPRMRGKLPLHNAIIAHFRITPADAGKTSMMSMQDRRKQDHPRGCGENFSGGIINV